MSAAKSYKLGPQTQWDSFNKSTEKHLSNHNKSSSKLFTAFHRLLNQDQQNNENLSTAETTDLINALTHLQQKQGGTKDRAAAIEEAVLQASSDSQLQPQEEEAINKITYNTIDIVKLLFKTIINNQIVPNAMKQLLGQLQIPILKVAILDKSFFTKKEHPARQLLNQLIQATLTWSEAPSPDQDELYIRIHATIQNILAEFTQEISLFEQVTQEFNAYLDHEQHIAKVLEKRMQKIAMGKEKLEIAKQQVMREINSRVNGRELPPILTTLVHDGWMNLLLLINMQQGQKSKAWKKSLVLIDQLLWSIEPKRTPADRQKLNKLIPALYRQLKEGLLCISFDPDQIELLLKELRTYQITSMHSAYQNKEGEHKTLVIEPSTVHPHKQPNNVEEIVIIDPQLTLFNIGAWFEITDDSGTKIRAKLAWRSIIDSSLILVNRQGVRVLETSTSVLNHQIQNGTAQVLSNLDTPLVDQALRSMADKLKALGVNSD